MSLGEIEGDCVTEHLGVVLPLKILSCECLEEPAPSTSHVVTQVWGMKLLAYRTGVSKGEALVKTAISEAPLVCFRALTQAELRWTNPVWCSFRKALKAVTRADMVAHTG